MDFFKIIFGSRKKPARFGITCKDIRGLVDGSPIPQFVIDRNHTVIYWNKALAEYSGMASEEVVGTNQHWRAFYGYERPCLADLLIDGQIEMISKLYKGKYSKSKLVPEAYTATDFFPAMGKGGKWLYFTAAPIKDGKGAVIGAVETLEDVTERKKAEIALEKHAENLQKSKKALIGAVKDLKDEKIKLGKEKAKGEAILMSIGDGLVITDNEGKVMFVNSVFENMVGWKLREIAGRHLFEIMPCQDENGNAVPPEKRLVSRVLGGEKPKTAVFYYVAKDGTRFPGAVTVRDISFDGNVIGTVSVLRDATRRKDIDQGNRL